MTEYICFLITVLSLADGTICDCAVKVKRDLLNGDCAEYPMEPENRGFLHAMLPEHVREIGPIVRVGELFEVHCI